MRIERSAVGGGNAAQDFAHEARLDGGDLRLDAARDIEAAACQSDNGKSTLPGCEEIGTTNRSPGKLPKPMTMAGRTLRLLKSVNGIGSRTMSSREQLIENVVGSVVPCLAQTALGLGEPGAALGIGNHRLDGKMDASVFG